EQSSASLWQGAQRIAATGNPQSLAVAIQQAQELQRDTYVWAAAQPRLEQLATKLLDHGEWQCQQGDLTGAIATARQVAMIPSLAEEAGYLEQLCQAQQLAIATMIPWTPSIQDSVQLMQAYAMLETIPPSSRFHAHTHRHLRQWQAQLEDLRHLHVAHLAASLGWSPTLAWAVQQTEQVTPQRPRRLQAQTLAAHWKLQLGQTQQHSDVTWSNQIVSTISMLGSLNRSPHVGEVMGLEN
ncbi:MAG: hypothetical protein F6K30_21360, partial [Cyanothece sp. SIO2G6]|nr:hypothetical protein [Cyanothece sp. SIO2G6]